MRRSKWDQRIERAQQLACEQPFAGEILLFYKQVATLQKDLYSCLEGMGGNGFAKRGAYLFDQEPNTEFLLPKFPAFLSQIEPASPDAIVQAARSLKLQTSQAREELLSSCWRHDSRTNHGPESVLIQTFLQPFAEFLAENSDSAPQNEAISVCPFCHGKPVVGVLRQEGDGGKRSLICSLCHTEWKYGRIRCVACGEEAVEKLAVYTAEQFPHVRVEACDSCRYYVKTVDLTKNGLAVPIVDELATLPLNLWAQEHQYHKFQPNLLGI